MVEMELGMNPIYSTLIGQRIRNKLIDHAYSKDYKGSHDDLLDSIDALSTVVGIVETAVADVIKGEVEVLAQRDPQTKTLTLFMAGLLHAKDMIVSDKSLIGKVDLE
jgi:hypothetical protein